MKMIWRVGVLLAGLALVLFAVERTGLGCVVRELHTMSGALVVILALGIIRLRLQTHSWALALRQGGVEANATELMFLRLASQGIGYLTVLGPAASEPMKIKLLQHHGGSATAATLVDTGAYWMSAGLVLIAGSISTAFVLTRNRGASMLVAALVAVGLYLLARPDTIVDRMASHLGKRSPGWLAKAAQIEREIRRFAVAHPAVIRRMFLLDLLCQALLLAEIAVALYFLHLPLRAGSVLSIEAAGRVVRLLGGWMPARIGADEGGAAAAFSAVGFPAAAGLALALVRRVRDMASSLAGLIWLAWRTRSNEDSPLLTGALQCKL
jgi:hypothetical protein